MFFDSVSLAEEDSILGLAKAFEKEPNPHKVNMGIGAYKTADDKPLLLTCVARAEALLLKKSQHKEYLPIEGMPEFINSVESLLFGDHRPQAIFTAQTVGGTGALRLGAEFIAQEVGPVIYVSDPSWANHKPIFEQAGLVVHPYPYYNFQNNTIRFNEFCAAIEKMPPSSAVLLQGCCHNPTGFDLSFDQWQVVSALIKKQKILPFFDIAYHGFKTDLKSDLKPVRYFLEQGHEMFISYTFSKNFGLYGERVGFLTAVTKDPLTAKKVGSQCKLLIRSLYSNPPRHGAEIVHTVLSSPALTLEWKEELRNMRDRVAEMRTAFIASLMVRAQHIDFSYMQNQAGLFSFCGLDPHMVARLAKEKGLFLPPNGRINIASLNTLNLDYVADAIVSVL